MRKVLDAVYENGVIRPLKRVRFKESQRLKIIVANDSWEKDLEREELDLLSNQEVHDLLGVDPDNSIMHEQIEKELSSIRDSMAEACIAERAERW